MTMTPKQDFALKIHRASISGRTSVRDSDLSRLVEHWPWLRDLCEEVQHLRDANDRLSDEVEDLTRPLAD